MRLAAEGVTVRLGARIVLDGIDAAAEGGELVGLIGPNGAGRLPCCASSRICWSPRKGWCAAKAGRLANTLPSNSPAESPTSHKALRCIGR